jgi:aspartate/methionine/tyrosine aminotransferase
MYKNSLQSSYPEISETRMKLNQQLHKIRQSPTVAITDRILALSASGQKIIPLQVGDPDFATPPAVLDSAAKAMRDGLTHYAPSRGFDELRLAISTKLLRDNGLSYQPETEILVTHGSIHAYYLAVQSLLEPGDEVLIPDPTWMTHVNMVKMLRGKVIHVPASSENGFIPPIETWTKSLTDKTRMIVLNYPSNPTGAYPSRDYLAQLMGFAEKHDLWVISDEVYENIYYGDKPVSAGEFSGAKERTIIVNSLSKTYAMTGWRVGYMAAPALVIENALKASQNSITCVSPFVQKAAAFALTDRRIQEAAAEMRAAYARRRELVLRIAGEVGKNPLQIKPPQGAFYFFLDFRSLKMSSLEICEQILDEVGVGLVPGSAFGKMGEGFVRMAITASDEAVETGFKAILAWANKQVGG